MPNEAEFRRWMVSNAPKSALIQTIETSTGTGIPDLFLCNQGCPCWIELKDAEGMQCYMRTSQWLWMRRLVKAGGVGFLIIRRKSKKIIDVYDAYQLFRQDPEKDVKFNRSDVFFNKKIRPVFSHEIGQSPKDFFDRLLQYQGGEI